MFHHFHCCLVTSARRQYTVLYSLVTSARRQYTHTVLYSLVTAARRQYTHTVLYSLVLYEVSLAVEHCPALFVEVIVEAHDAATLTDSVTWIPAK